MEDVYTEGEFLVYVMIVSQNKVVGSNRESLPVHYIVQDEDSVLY